MRDTLAFMALYIYISFIRTGGYIDNDNAKQ